MAWIVQNTSNSIVCIDDLGIVLQRGQTRDLDLLGRENCERSRFLKNALSGLLTEIKKDVITPAGSGIDAKMVDAMKKTTEQAVAAATAAQDTVKIQADMIKKQDAVMAQQSAALKDTTAVLDKVKDLVEKFPEEMKAIKNSLSNIKIERSAIAEQQKDITDGTSDAEIKAHEKILKKKDAELEKNYKQLGQTITKKVDAELGEALSALDELGI